ncbi:hypothetical protein CKAH01_14586 [Colletotrichum kahawae]|uniref:Uncharacterized protein n=1 Tax=Colletotrichum kahawae TaxID=34407 RepID=A0AAD9YMJ9_COLKA|nr:hypothetical protein CKAH01_14586 [Colletotrichum kahawae]
MSDSRENTPTFSFFYHHYYHHYGLINIHIHSIILYVDCLIHTLVTVMSPVDSRLHSDQIPQSIDQGGSQPSRQSTRTF